MFWMIALLFVCYMIGGGPLVFLLLMILLVIGILRLATGKK